MKKEVTDPDYKILFEKLCEKLKRMRGLQRKRNRLRGYFPVQDKNALYRYEREVDNILLLDPEGQVVFQKITSNG